MKIYSNDIHCKNCANRIIKAFAEENITVTVNIAEKYVELPDEKQAFALELLDDLGFTPNK